MSKREEQLVLCIRNEDYPVSLERNKLYLMLPDEGEEDLDMVRVIDESGEDYLYPRRCFAILPKNALAVLRIPAKTRRQVMKSLGTA